MPRYFFNLHDGRAAPDEEGVDLPGLPAARHMAAQFLGEAIKDAGTEFCGEREWHLDVTNERGVVLFSASTFLHDAAVARTRSLSAC